MTKTENKTRAENRIAAALGSMPYGALAGSRANISHLNPVVRMVNGRAALDLDRLADYLEALRDVLNECAANDRERDEQARTAETELRAVASVLVRHLPKKRLAALLVKAEGR